jgi:ubiquinone/menaquinone biosynthesis C-methylase UbiE
VRALDPAGTYARHVGRYGPELAPAFLRFADVDADVRALDVGCGPGALTEVLASAVGPDRVAAVDPSPEYVGACRRRVPGVDVRIGQAEALPFDDGVFDAVLSQLVVQALDDAPQAAREMARVLAPGGVMATCVWDFREGMPLLGAYWAAARAVDPEGARRAGADLTNPWCTPDGLRRLWGEAGMEELETRELSAGAEYEGCDDAWWPFAAGVSASGAYCRSLDDQRRAALREEFCHRLGEPHGPFRLTARAWSIRGRARDPRARSGSPASMPHTRRAVSSRTRP